MSLKKFFVNFYFTSIKFIKIYYIIVKIISSIFNIYLFYFSHLYVHSIKFYLPNLCFFVSIKFNARNIIFNQRPIVINKINSNFNKNCKNYYHHTIYTLQEPYLLSFSLSKECNSIVVISANFTSSIVSVNSSINLSTNFFLHLQFL